MQIEVNGIDKRPDFNFTQMLKQEGLYECENTDSLFLSAGNGGNFVIIQAKSNKIVISAIQHDYWLWNFKLTNKSVTFKN